MKWIKLYEEFSKKNKLILLDGASSSGKTTTTQKLGAKPFLKATKKDKIVVIGSDDFSNFENRIPYDHKGKGFDKEAGEVWHKTMPEKRKDDDKELQKRGMTTVGWPKHPHHKELDGDPRVWYMAQAANENKDKTIFFDDIGKSILHYLPKTIHILLHAPIPILLENVKERSKKGKMEQREPQMVLEQYLEKYRAQKKKPDESEGDPNLVLNKKFLKELLEKYKLDKKFIPKFIKDLGIDDDDDYYIKVKRGYLGKNAYLITIDEKRESYIEKIEELLKIK
jgi:hypothetical protein